MLGMRIEGPTDDKSNNAKRHHRQESSPSPHYFEAKTPQLLAEQSARRDVGKANFDRRVLAQEVHLASSVHTFLVMVLSCFKWRGVLTEALWEVKA